MNKRTILVIFSLLVLLLGVAFVPITAQDEEAAPSLVFDVPEGYESVEVLSSIDSNNAHLEKGDETILIFGPDTYQAVLSTGEFEDDSSAFSFFLQHTGYSLGSEVDSMYDNVLVVMQVSLARRSQQGLAYLVDLGVGLHAIVVSLHTGRGRVGAPPPDVEVVLNSIAFPLDIVDAATTEGSFTTFVAAVQAAGLEDTLRGEGPFTVFAPNDDAFDAFRFSFGLTDDQLLAADYLDELLLYHVVAGNISSADLAETYLDQTSIPTLLPVNNIFVFTGVDDKLYVNTRGAEIIATDINVTNGVIHVLNGVLLPQCVIDALNGSGGCN